MNRSCLKLSWRLMKPFSYRSLRFFITTITFTPQSLLRRDENLRFLSQEWWRSENFCKELATSAPSWILRRWDTCLRRWNAAIERDGDYVEKYACEPVMYSYILIYDIFYCISYFLYNRINCITFWFTLMFEFPTSTLRIEVDKFSC